MLVLGKGLGVLIGRCEKHIENWTPPGTGHQNSMKIFSFSCINKKPKTIQPKPKASYDKFTKKNKKKWSWCAGHNILKILTSSLEIDDLMSREK